MPGPISPRGAARAGARRLTSCGLVLVATALALAVVAVPPGAGDGGAGREGRRDVVMKRLPRRAWALSLDLRVAPRTTLVLGFGSSRPLRIRRGAARTVVAVLPGGRRARVRGVRRGGFTVLHIQALRGARASVEVALGRKTSRIPTSRGRRLVVRVARGQAIAGPPLVTPLRDTARLLLHRLANLDARAPPGRFLRGADAGDRLHYSARSWTRGFLAGALWQAAALVPGDDSFERAALQRTRDAFGYELAATHDLGFVYENSSVAAYGRLCRRARARPLCEELRTSGLEAADGLLELAASNPFAGTIPTRESRPSPLVADTLVDSLMNLPLLYWASRATRNPSYRRLAARHAHRLAELLVRPDGTTGQSVHFDRATGRVLRIHTHQGFSDESTWARGQGWAVYGFTVSAAALHDRELLRTAERTAAWVDDHLPASGVPPYDYGAPLGGPVDTSAAVITAAGALRLARLCERWAVCEDPGRWSRLGRRMLRGALRYVSRSLPLGYFGHQVGVFGGSKSWDDDAELVYGLRYALEAVRLAR